MDATFERPVPADHSTAPMVHLEDVSRVHLRGGRGTEVLAGVDLAIGAGEFVAVMGPSGSGKTTLLNLIGGLDRPSRGRVRVQGVALDRMTRGALARWRAAQVGFVFQFYNLIPVLDARHNVALPLSLQRLPRAERRRRAEDALRLVGLEHRMCHHPHELSGGEQQRVAIARAIVTNPSLLLCDEPTGDLDRQTGVEIMELLSILNRDYGKTVVMVTHDPEAARFARRTIRLDKGRLATVA
ncbi:MAG TPA: ABC transporter ATP-binding protein [Xanthomonadaceae bacterium]|jgi:putative ABC transport system ATP-binding protein|nr:ABC transporter ATP-binding protein [Xanthomonadaceae bacterium]